ncbi:MAG: peptidoglycan DD-metalloendopeptidase family protein, partial [Proteobacteria bacterium]|nr:peptidoglycan DD-metalloendopeptidase family protein [Pseudomonadota bacterium]
EVSKRFGARDALGGLERGVTFAANGGAVVTAPADGWVHFAAPFRGYGHLLIINAGNGYHVVLAGMERLSVDIGQFVLAGEPVGFMPAAAPANAPAGTVSQGTALGVARPALYVEFRKDGSPVDPSPWWTSQLAEKARG